MQVLKNSGTKMQVYKTYKIYYYNTANLLSSMQHIFFFL